MYRKKITFYSSKTFHVYHIENLLYTNTYDIDLLNNMSRLNKKKEYIIGYFF